MIGRTIAHYEILEMIGSGGMGEVYRARDTKLNREVALKVLPADVAADPSSLERFEREAKALAALNHSNIVTIYSVETDSNPQFLTMELLKGRTLREITPPGGLELDAFLEIAIALTSALSSAHDHGIIHRDLKPDNIMLTESGVVKILDFGLAKLCRALPGESSDSAATEHNLTVRGQMMGTVDYMSPEQVRGSEVDLRSDLFSLGVLFHELLGERHPFRRASAPETLSAIANDLAPGVHDVNPRLPERIGQIVRRCLEKDPQRRVQSALDLHNQLLDLHRELRAANSTQGSHTVERRETARKRKLARPMAMVVGVVVLVTAIYSWRSDLWNGSSEHKDGIAGEPGLVRLMILPFENLGLDEDQFFVEGMHEEIARRLSAIQGLGIISQTSASGLRVEDRTFQDIGGEFDCEFIMTAGIFTDRSQPGAEQVRVTPRIVQVQDNLQVWSESFRAELVPGEIFSVQARIAERVAESMDINLVHGDHERIHLEPTLDAGAYDNYLLGRYYWNRRTPDTIRRAVRHFELAIERDPEFVQAYAGLADAYAVYPFFGILDRSPAEAFDIAEQMARKALDLNPGLAEAHASLAFARMYGQWDWDGADRSFRHALELAPDYVVGHYWYCELLICVGDYKGGLQQARLAVELEPALPIARHLYGIALMCNGQLEEAVIHANRALELDPAFIFPRFTLALIELVEGRVDGWEREMIRMGFPRSIVEIEGSVLRGELTKARAVQLMVENLRRVDPEPTAMQRGHAFLYVGELELAMESFEKAAEEQDPLVTLLPTWTDIAPVYAQIRSHPGYAVLLEKMGLRQGSR